MREQFYMALTGLGSIDIKMNKTISRKGRGGGGMKASLPSS